MPEDKVASATELPPEPMEEEGTITLAELLEKLPPGSLATVKGAIGDLRGNGYRDFLAKDVRLHCSSENCGGVRTYQVFSDRISSISKEWSLGFLVYQCRNCERSRRTFALRVRLKTKTIAEVEKFGELPPFGPPLPARVITLIGPDKDLFLRGRRSENQGLGIGAFVYYRRVVDNQWQRLLTEIIRVSEVTGAPGPMIATLKAAANETQFSKAVDMIKEGIPDVLKVRGQNPLTLLYSSISDGLHDGTDQHCLELAGSVRVVLTELAERIGQALKDESELTAAVTKLMAAKAKQKPEGK